MQMHLTMKEEFCGPGKILAKLSWTGSYANFQNLVHCGL
jgi:hypothetical protein